MIVDKTHIINYYYWSPRSNFENAGDYFNKILMDNLYHCVCNPLIDDYTNVDIALCGSILNHSGIKYAKHIIGCGFQNSRPAVNKDGKVYKAVRGRLTYEKLKKEGIKVGNDVKFVDPGLMVSKLYNIDELPKKYKIGIIPHYLDESDVRKKYGGKYHIISMKTTDVKKICKQIKECDVILSSSLHGIIFSHSVGVPAYHIVLKKLQDGDNFKFRDYYSCYNRNIIYKNFICDDTEIPFKNIIEYHNKNKKSCNPTKEEIEKKQTEFLSVLPYKNLLNKKYLI